MLKSTFSELQLCRYLYSFHVAVVAS